MGLFVWENALLLTAKLFQGLKMKCIASPVAGICER
jgi:hypothetical protein